MSSQGDNRQYAVSGATRRRVHDYCMTLPLSSKNSIGCVKLPVSVREHGGSKIPEEGAPAYDGGR